MNNDITFCSGFKKGLQCSLKENCRRYRKSQSKTIEIVSFFFEAPFEIKKDKIKCDFYINNGGVTELVSLKDIFTGNLPKRKKIILKCNINGL